MFKGSFTALITPFIDEDRLDETSFKKLIKYQLDNGTDGVIPCGTTGKSPTLSYEEFKKVIEITVKEINKKIPVIAGTGTNCTKTTVEKTKLAKEIGADAGLVVTPYYNKPTQDGLYGHFMRVADVGLPLVIYNIPARSVVNITLDTMAKLSKHPNIVGLKDATADLAYPLALRSMIGDKWSLLSGEDATATSFLAQGGHGCISVSSNVAPKLCSQMHKAWQSGNLKEMGEMRDKLMPLHQVMFCETSPGPVKYAASLLGIGNSYVRMPLCEISENSKVKVKKALTDLELI